MILIATTLIISLMSYRIWRLVAIDAISKPARKWVFNEVRSEKTLFAWMKVWLTCPWCAGTWITAAVTLATDLIVDGGIPMPVLVFGAASAGTGLFGSYDPDIGMVDDI